MGFSFPTIRLTDVIFELQKSYRQMFPLVQFWETLGGYMHHDPFRWHDVRQTLYLINKSLGYRPQKNRVNEKARSVLNHAKMCVCVCVCYADVREGCTHACYFENMEIRGHTYVVFHVGWDRVSVLIPSSARLADLWVSRNSPGCVPHLIIGVWDDRHTLQCHPHMISWYSNLGCHIPIASQPSSQPHKRNSYCYYSRGDSSHF